MTYIVCLQMKVGGKGDVHCLCGRPGVITAGVVYLGVDVSADSDLSGEIVRDLQRA